MYKLTIQQKAIAYDEAVCKMKEIITMDNTPTIPREIGEYLFPELRESEDEKIRKGIIKYLSWIKDRDGSYMPNNIPFEEMIAWLEKQGKPKDINPSEFDLRLNKLLKQFETLPKEELASSLSFYLNVVQNDGTYKAEEKQGEQPRYSIGDVLCDKSCTTLNKDAQSNFEITDIRNGMYICDKCSFPISQQDEYELVDKKIEQKPAELSQSVVTETSDQVWSEEDESNLDLAIYHIRREPYRESDVEPIVDWLRTLKDRVQPQPKQEWSEEDKNKLNRIYMLLAEAADEHAFSTTCRLIGDNECVELQDFLKSLKPQNHWKPTEDQMEALHDLNLTGYISYAGQGQVLIELYKQLEKL